MYKTINIILCFSIFFAGCAGRTANPVQIYYPDDENRSCLSLKTEMEQIQKEMYILRPKTNKFTSNALLTAAGIFLIFPFFFMDMKDAEKIEYDAYARRYDRLLILAKEKNCELSGLPTNIKSFIDAKYKKAKKIEMKQNILGDIKI